MREANLQLKDTVLAHFHLKDIVEKKKRKEKQTDYEELII